MKKFLSKKKVVIVAFTIIFVLILSLFSNVFGVKYEALDFKVGKVTASCLNVRCGPGMDYKKVGKLYNGDYIDVFAKFGNWYIIQTDSNLIGAVSSDYIEAVHDENERYAAKADKEQEEAKKDNDKNAESKEVAASQAKADEKRQEANNAQDENKQQEVAQSGDEVLAEFANSFALTKEEQEFLDLINANRNLNGLSPLEVDEQVQNIARLKAKDLVENNYFSHTSPTYGKMEDMLGTFDIKYLSVGENIAGNASLAGAVEAWMNSENHKANILSEKYDCTGIAIVDSKAYGKVFVQVFVQKE